MSPVQLGSAFGTISLSSEGVIKATSESERAVQKMQKTMQESSNRIQASMSLQAQKEQALAQSAEEMGRRVANAWALQEQKAQALKAQNEALYDSTLKIGVGLTAAAAGAGAFIYSTVKLAARVETLGVVTVQLGKNVGYTEEQIRALEKAIQDKGITMQASRQAIAQMIEAEIDLGRATDLARLAQDAAVISGQNSSEAFENLVYSIASGNVMMLRRMGILVNFNNAYIKEAQALGKSSTALTEHEKLVIRTNVVMNAGKNIVGAYEAAMETAGKKITSLDRHLEESKRMLGEAWLPIYADVIDFVTNSLKAWENLDQSQKDNVTTWITYGTTLTAAEGIMFTTIGTVGKLKTAMDALNITMGAGGIAGLVTTLGPAAILIGGLTIAVTYAIRRNAELGKAAEQAAKGTEIQMQAVANGSQTYEEYLDKTKKVLAAQHLNVQETENGIKVYDGQKGILEDVTKKYDIMTEAQWNNYRAMNAAIESDKEMIAKMKAMGYASEDLTSDLEEQAAATDKLAESMANDALQSGLSGDLTKGWNDYQKTMADLKKEHEELTTELGKNQRAELGIVAASNYVKDALNGANRQAYQPFLRANKDLVEKHSELEKQMIRAKRVYGESSDEAKKYTDQLAANERQLVLAARSQDLQKQLDELKRKGYDPNSKAVQELNQKLAENEQAQKDAAAAASYAIKQFIYEKAALDLPVEAATELAKSMGLIDDDTYNAVKAQQELRKEYEDTEDLEQYVEETGLLADAIERLKSKDITITETTIKREIIQIQHEQAGVGKGHNYGSINGGAAGAPVFPNVPIKWNEPGYQGETLVIPTNGQILNRLDSMKAAQAAFSGATGGGQGGAALNIVNNFYDQAAAALGMAEVRRIQKERLKGNLN